MDERVSRVAKSSVWGEFPGITPSLFCLIYPTDDSTCNLVLLLYSPMIEGFIPTSLFPS